jgi:hypothetical protein
MVAVVFVSHGFLLLALPHELQRPGKIFLVNEDGAPLFHDGLEERIAQGLHLGDHDERHGAV